MFNLFDYQKDLMSRPVFYSSREMTDEECEESYFGTWEWVREIPLYALARHKEEKVNWKREGF
jgi:hypothetical protein